MSKEPQKHYDIAAVPVERVIDVRHRVLRAGRPRSTATFDGDDDAGVLHFAIALGDRTGTGALTLDPVGAVSLYPRLSPRHETTNSWQLRGMAVDHAVQGQGIGALLLDHALQAVEARGAQLVWCNARVRAERLYLRAGFVTDGDMFEIPDVGPHVFMARPC